MNPSTLDRFRVLIVDDNPSIHEDFKVVLTLPTEDTELEEQAAFLFGEEASESSRKPRIAYDLSFATQGQEAHEMVKESIGKDEPFALAFVDMRMPPGWDGLVTIERLWKEDPALQIVICTAFSDYSWTEVIERLGQTDNLLILKKPFDSAEVAQMATALTRKWDATRRVRTMMTDLELRVQERTSELEEARAAAEAASRAKSEFLAMMSHEIRTPMNGIMGAISMIMEQEWPPQQQEYLEIIQTSGDSLLTIIDEILDLSKIEAGKCEIESSVFDLRRATDLWVKPLSLLAAEKGLSFRFNLDEGAPRFVRGDPVRIRQILNNLIDNAIKFTAKGEVSVHIGYEHHDPSGGVLTATIRDTGIGIPEEKQRQIFAKFTQADSSTTRRFGGSGLGLTISSLLAHLMNGKVSVESREGAGSTFTFWIPLPEATGEETRDVRPCQGDDGECADDHLPEGMRVLLVEDNVVNQKIAKNILESLGCLVEVADNGKGALEIFEGHDLDLVFMDCQMPLMDGFEAAKGIREKEGGKDRVPIVAMTAYAMSGDRQRCLDAGMDDYLTKPVTKETLRGILRRWASAKTASL